MAGTVFKNPFYAKEMNGDTYLEVYEADMSKTDTTILFKMYPVINYNKATGSWYIIEEEDSELVSFYVEYLLESVKEAFAANGYQVYEYDELPRTVREALAQQ